MRVGVANVLRGMTLAEGYVVVEHFLRTKRMKARVTNEGLVCVFGSTGNESGHVFDPDVMLEMITLVVGTLQQGEVDMVRTITFFSDIERDITLVIALAQNVDADIGVQGLKTGYVSNGQGKCETGDVQSIFVGSIVANSVWMIYSWV